MAAKVGPLTSAKMFADDMQQAYGEQLQALLLIGSAARGDFIAGKSDINTLVVFSSAGLDALDKTYPILKSWRKKGLAVPYFMTSHSINSATDTYPLELLDFKCFHKVLVGEDILADLSLPLEAIRLQIERESRAKLYLLRQIFAAHAGSERELALALHRSLVSFTAIFQGVLALEKRPIPAEKQELILQAAATVGFSPSVFQHIVEMRKGTSKVQAQAIFKELMREVTKIVSWVDGYEVK
jgi:hypothetical protein